MILNGRVINPGELRTRITLKQRTVSSQTGGFQTPTLTAVATVWSRWSNAHGSESLQAALVGAQAPATVLIRYYAGVDPTWVITKGSDDYEVISVDNIQERNEYMELKVQRIKAG